MSEKKTAKKKVLKNTPQKETVFKYLSRIDDELQEIKSEIKALKGEFTKKSDLARLESLEKRVVKLELIIQKRKLANA